MSMEVHRRRKGSSHQLSPKSSSPVVAVAASRRSSGCSEIMERPSSPRSRPSETNFSVQGLRGGGSQGTGGHRTRTRGRTVENDGVPTRNGSEASARTSASTRSQRSWPPGPAGRSVRASPCPSSTTRCKQRRVGAGRPRRRRAGRGRPGARHRPPVARGTRRDARRGRRLRSPAGAGGASGGDRGLARGGQAVPRGDRGRVQRCALRRQRGVAPPTGRRHERHRGGRLRGSAVGRRRSEVAPRRRQREGRGTSGGTWRTGYPSSGNCPSGWGAPRSDARRRVVARAGLFVHAQPRCSAAAPMAGRTRAVATPDAAWIAAAAVAGKAGP